MEIGINSSVSRVLPVKSANSRSFVIAPLQIWGIALEGGDCVRQGEASSRSPHLLPKEDCVQRERRCGAAGEEINAQRVKEEDGRRAT